MEIKLTACKKCGELRGPMKGGRIRLCLCDITNSKGKIDFRIRKNEIH